MSVASALDLASEVASAHEAPTLAAAAEIRVSFACGGLAFASRGQPLALRRAEARLSPLHQRAELRGQLPRPWTFTSEGSADLRSRLERLRCGARRLRWQPEDVGAFATAALWTYLMAPLLLDAADQVERLPDAGGLRRLRLALPPGLAGHASTQTLHIGPLGLIERHDYTATAFGRWAHAAQVVTHYATFDGVPVGTRRRVTPRIGARRLSRPELVWIEIHQVRLVGTC